MKNTFRLLMLCSVVWLSSHPGASHASGSQGNGTVTLNGSITETPCMIDTQSRDQSIDMGAIPVAILARDGQSEARSFRIHLVRCSLRRVASGAPDWREFQVTFDGPAENGLFSVSGAARGVVLRLTDSNGNDAHPGEPLTSGKLAGQDQVLNYTLRLVSNRQRLQAGDLYSTLRFRLDYN